MKHITLGQIGEETVKNHLKRKGFKLIEQNYRKKWGEIDLIMKKKKKLHFIEVKTVSHETYVGDPAETVSRENNMSNVSHETWRPEDNVDRRKLKKILRAVETWLSENKYDGEWQLDVVAVKLDRDRRVGTLKIIDNVVLEE